MSDMFSALTSLTEHTRKLAPTDLATPNYFGVGVPLSRMRANRISIPPITMCHPRSLPVVHHYLRILPHYKPILDDLPLTSAEQFQVDVP